MIRCTRDGARSRSVAKSGTRPRNQNRTEMVKYVDTAAASHGSAERSCGQTRIVGGYGKSQYANHGLPVWNTGKSAACMTAKTVIPSVKRLIDVRQRCSRR